jgi:hypothetical protein
MGLVDVYNMETRERDAHLRGGIEAWDRTTAEKGFVTPRGWVIDGDKQLMHVSRRA